MDDPLECSICKAEFEKPKQLPCLHSFCTVCLIKYCAEIKEEMKPCPICRKGFFLPQGGVTDLKCDEIIERLLIEKRLEERSQETLDQQRNKCEFCRPRHQKFVKAEYFCMNCKQGLCESGRDIHLNIPDLKLHKLVSIEEKPTELELEKMKSNFCTNHELKEKEEIKLYCCDCNLLICLTCNAESHNNHKRIELARGATEKKQLSINDSMALERCLAKSKDKIETANAALNDSQSTTLKSSEEIEREYRKYIEFLGRLKVKLLTKVQEFDNIRKKEIKSHIDIEELRYEVIKRFITYSRMVMERGTDCEIMRIADELHKRAEELINSQDGYKRQALTDRSVRFIPSSNFDNEEIDDLLGRFLYKGEWDDKELEVSSVVEAQWRGSAETIESTLNSLLESLEYCHCPDLISKIQNILKRLRDSKNRMEKQHKLGHRLSMGERFFELLNSSTRIFRDTLNKMIKTESELRNANEKLALELKKLKQDRSSQYKELETLTTTNEWYSERIDSLKDKLSSLESKYQEDIETATSEKRLLLTQHSSLQDELRSIREENDDEISDLTARLEAKEAERCRVDSKLKEEIRHSEQLAKNNERLNSLCGSLKILYVLGLDTGDKVEQKICRINLDRMDAINVTNFTPSEIGKESAACVFYNELYAVCIGPERNELWRCSESREWQRLANLRTGRRRHCVTCIGKKIYVLGGWDDANKKTLDSVVSYNINNKSWIQETPLRVAVRGAACVSYKHLIYIFGGTDASEEVVGHIQVYDTNTGKVSLSSNSMPAAKKLMKAVAWESKALLVGQWNCYIYDFERNSWEDRGKFGTGVSQFGLTISNGILFISGGSRDVKSRNCLHVKIRSDEVMSLSVDDFISDNKKANWKHHAKLPFPAAVYAFSPEPLHRYI